MSKIAESALFVFTHWFPRSITCGIVFFDSLPSIWNETCGEGQIVNRHAFSHPVTISSLDKRVGQLRPIFPALWSIFISAHLLEDWITICPSAFIPEVALTHGFAFAFTPTSILLLWTLGQNFVAICFPYQL